MIVTVSEVVCPLPERHTLFATLPKVVKKLSLGNPKVGRRCYFGDLIIRFLDLQEIWSTFQQPGPTSAQDSPHSPCFCGPTSIPCLPPWSCGFLLVLRTLDLPSGLLLCVAFSLRGGDFIGEQALSAVSSCAVLILPYYKVVTGVYMYAVSGETHLVS